MRKAPASRARGVRRPAGRRPRAQPAAPGAAERRLEEAQARYLSLVESLPVVTYVTALAVQGSFTYISPQVESLLGYTPDGWLADPRLWLSRIHRDDLQRVLPQLMRAQLGGQGISLEYRLLHRDGSPRWIRDESRVVHGKAGAPLCIQGTWTEITGRKELEREAARRSRELLSSKAELEQLVSAAAHELTAPLRRIVNLGELLEQRAGGRLDDESIGILARMRDSAARLQRLVAGLIQYSEQGEQVWSDVDLDGVVQRAIAGLADKIAAAGAEIEAAPLPSVRGDAELLERVVVNLLDNALKFRGARPPHVRLWAQRSGADWLISIRDNGIGIHPRETQRIFMIFDPVHSRRTSQGEGLGLGLPVCRKIVESFGGRIWVESEPGEGSTFHFTLPSAAGGPAP